MSWHSLHPPQTFAGVFYEPSHSRYHPFAACAAISVAFACAATANAQSVLYYADGFLNPSGNITPKALTAQGITPTTATSEADFVAKLGAGGWDLAILLEQVSELPEAKTAMVSWIAGGGRALTASSSADTAFIAAFNAGYLGATRVDKTIVSSNRNAIWNGVASPLTLNSALGYGTFSTELAATTCGVVAGTFETGSAAIVISNGGKTRYNGFLDDTYEQQSEADRIRLVSRQIQATLNAGAVVVPEPGTLGLAVLGVGSLAALRARRGRNVKHAA